MERHRLPKVVSQEGCCSNIRDDEGIKGVAFYNSETLFEESNILLVEEGVKRAVEFFIPLHLFQLINLRVVNIARPGTERELLHPHVGGIGPVCVGVL